MDIEVVWTYDDIFKSNLEVYEDRNVFYMMIEDLGCLINISDVYFSFISEETYE